MIYIPKSYAKIDTSYKWDTFYSSQIQIDFTLIAAFSAEKAA